MEAGVRVNICQISTKSDVIFLPLGIQVKMAYHSRFFVSNRNRPWLTEPERTL